MTTLNLKKGRFLLPALQHLIIGLTGLSRSDTALNQKVYALHHFISAPEEVNGEELLQTIRATKDLAAGYELEGDAKTLPAIFQGVISEVDHLLASKKLTKQDEKFAAKTKIEQFYKSAIRDN